MSAPRLQPLFLSATLLTMAAACSVPPSQTTPSEVDPQSAIGEARPAAERPAHAGAEGSVMDAAHPLSEGQRWRLQHSSDPVIAAAATRVELSLEIVDGRMTGNSGCNRFSASFEQGPEGRLEVGPAMASKRACVDEALNSAEQRFLAALSAADRIELRAGVLTLSGPGTPSLDFRAGLDTPQE